MKKILTIAALFLVIPVVLTHFLAHPKERVSPDHRRIQVILNREGKKLGFENCERLKGLVTELGEKYALDPLLILALIHVESHFNAEAKSNKGALGLMQVTPIVIREVKDELSIDTSNTSKLLKNQESNLRIGTHYLSSLVTLFKGDTLKALLAYNRGPTAVSRIYKNRNVPVEGYQKKVIKTYALYLQS